MAFDTPIRNDTQQLVGEFDEHVIRGSRRIQRAKDAFIRPEHFQAVEPPLEEWERVRSMWHTARRFRSVPSARLPGELT